MPHLLIAAIAASSALAGVLISQAISLFQAWLNRKSEQQKLLRQKYERMMDHFFATTEWLYQASTCTHSPSLFRLPPSKDARLILMMTYLYFPTLEEAADAYFQALKAYHALLISSFRDEVPAEARAQARAYNEEEYKAVKAALFEKQNEFQNLAREAAKKYIGA